MNDITLSFFASARPHSAPRSISLRLGPHQTGAFEVGTQLTGDAGAIGALRIRSSAPLIADARLYSRAASEVAPAEVGTVLEAIPAHDAIGTGESSVLHMPAGLRYKLYAVETHGFPLYFSVSVDHAERRLYLSPNEHRIWDIGELFPGVRSPALRVTGINGSGKIIVAGTAISMVSEDFVAFEMSHPAAPRHRMRWPEIVAYAAVAMAIAFSAVYGLKKR
jgi:hypothetical protein